MTHEESCGKDVLVEIYSCYAGGGCTEVVRWCPKCGAVAVDLDYDGRTQPGRGMPMRFPEAARVWRKEKT